MEQYNLSIKDIMHRCQIYQIFNRKKHLLLNMSKMEKLSKYLDNFTTAAKKIVMIYIRYCVFNLFVTKTVVTEIGQKKNFK